MLTVLTSWLSSLFHVFSHARRNYYWYHKDVEVLWAAPKGSSSLIYQWRCQLPWDPCWNCSAPWVRESVIKQIKWNYSWKRASKQQKNSCKAWQGRMMNLFASRYLKFFSVLQARACGWFTPAHVKGCTQRCCSEILWEETPSGWFEE